MPSYTFLNTQSGEVFTTIMSIAEREDYLKANPHIQQQLISAPALGDSIRLGLKKPDNGFRDRLKEIKKHHSKGITKSTVNTF
ncbi:hypothetical protein UFOVP395_127 [uncultured Caudovirales phage]|jgi:hypothetical protein|uniref:Uncharacterized protein n=1 Tax=uncultured Caudovirales phage TaxID=2100421 RepID=A0A6J5M3J7_9CAUD|nr:hypothetical protein UFOVP395_127 [uncultured Caudovirales phage]